MQDPDFHIVHKLDFYRESGHQRHLRDIAGMIEQQELDHEFLKTSIQSLGLQSQWQAAQDLTNKP